MASFTIECTTCRARLKVRDESAIGQILTCPKCSSMVLVECPTEPSGPAGPDQSHPEPHAIAGSTGDEAFARPPDTDASGVLDGAAPPSSLAPPAPSAETSPPPGEFPATSTPADAAAPSDAAVPSAESSPPTDTVTPATSQDQNEGPVGPLSDTVEDLSVYGTQLAPPPSEIPLPQIPASVMSEQLLLPTDAWSSESSHRVRNWLMLGGAATIGIFVAVGVFALVAMQLARDNQPVAKGDPTANETKPHSPGGDPAGGDAVVGTPDSPESGLETQPPGDASAAAAAADGTQPGAGDAAAGLPETGDPDAGDATGAARPPATGTDSVPPTAVEGTLPDDARNPDEEEVPPGFVARVSSDERPPGFASSGESTASDDESLDKTLLIFEALLDDKGPAPDESAAPAMTDLEVEATGPPRPAPRVVDVAARLTDTFEEIKFDGTSLHDFLRFVASFSTIPITLDPDALLWLDVTPETPVSAHQKAATVRELVEPVVAGVGLTAQVMGDQMLVTLPEEGIHERRYAVGDLAPSPAEVQALAEMLTRFVAPEAWQAAGGLGRIASDDTGLVIQQSSTVHRHVLRFLEKLRVVRGLGPVSEFPAAIFAADSRFARVSDQLAKEITLNFFQPTQLDTVTHQLGRASGCQILIDWEGLHQAGWNTDTMVTLTVNAVPLATALHEFLEPRGLGFRCVDVGLIQITTDTRLMKRIEFEVYPIQDLLDRSSAPEVMSKLQALLGAEWVPTAGRPGAISVDATSAALLAALPQPGQIALEKALREVRASAAK